MNALVSVLAVLALGLFFLPLYLPFLISFRVKAEDFREIRAAFRFASVLSIAVALMAMGSRNDYGDDVAGNMRAAVENFLWIWGSGLACLSVSLLGGAAMRWMRLRKTAGPAPQQ